jgi:hypothetical protein
MLFRLALEISIYYIGWSWGKFFTSFAIKCNNAEDYIFGLLSILTFENVLKNDFALEL